MEIQGRVTEILPLQGGVSAATGKAWQVETFIIETLENYPRKVAIEMFGEQRIKDNPVAVDGVYTISFDLESREFNGRWYTTARAWKIAAGATAPQPSAAPQAQAAAPVYAAPAPSIPAAPAVDPIAAAQPQAASNNKMDDSTELPF